MISFECLGDEATTHGDQAGATLGGSGAADRAGAGTSAGGRGDRKKGCSDGDKGSETREHLNSVAQERTGNVLNEDCSSQSEPFYNFLVNLLR